MTTLESLKRADELLESGQWSDAIAAYTIVIRNTIYHEHNLMAVLGLAKAHEGAGTLKDPFLKSHVNFDTSVKIKERRADLLPLYEALDAFKAEIDAL